MGRSTRKGTSDEDPVLLLYLAGTGILGFLLGRIVPKRWFCADRFPFRVRPWEQKLYQALRVKQWQNKVPDMSRVFPKLMPPKRLTPEMMDDLPRMIEETCVAEAVHALLSLTGLGFCGSYRACGAHFGQQCIFCLEMWRIS